MEKMSQAGEYYEDDNDIIPSITLCYDLTEIENINIFRQQLVEKYLALNPEERDAKKNDLIGQIPNQIDILNK